MFAVMHKLATHPPRSQPAQWKEVIHLWLVLYGSDEVHLEIQIVQEILHEVVNDISLVDLSETVDVE